MSNLTNTISRGGKHENRSALVGRASARGKGGRESRPPAFLGGRGKGKGQDKTWQPRTGLGDRADWVDSPVAVRVWTGFERYRSMGELIQVSPADAKAHEKAARRAVGEGYCVYLSMVAYMNAEWTDRLCRERWESCLGPDAFFGTLRRWGRSEGVMYVLHDLVVEQDSVTLSQGLSIGATDGLKRHLLRVPTELAFDVGGFHILPLGEPKLGRHPWACQPPETAGVEAEKSTGSAVAAVVVETPPARSSPVVEESPRLVDSSEQGNADWVCGRALGGFPAYLQTGQCVQTCYGPADSVGFNVPEGDGYYHWVSTEIFGNIVWSLEYVAEEKRPSFRYHGVYPPPAGADWTGGWWPSVRGAGERAGLFFAQGFMSRAHVRSACMETCQMLDNCLYLPFTATPGLRVVGCRMLTDGVRSTQIFDVGDVVSSNGRHFQAVSHREYGLDLIKLVPMQSRVGACMGRFLRYFRDSHPVLEPRLPKALPTELQNRVEWLLALQVAPADAVPILGNLKTMAAKEKYGEGTTGPWLVAEQVNVLRASVASPRVPFGYAGGKPFSWGYCYSCGRSLPGNMPGRLCGCGQTPAAINVAEGHHVAKFGVPCYPGVVETKSRHPPLKDGKETRATPAVFREPPLGVSSWGSCRPVRDVARVSAVSA